MKREIAFVASMIILGIVLGIGFVAILGAIAAPAYTNLILTQAEKADFELMSRQFNWVAKNPYPLLAIGILFIITAVILFFANLNPNLNLNKFKEKTPGLKAPVVLLCSGACIFLLSAPAVGLFSSFFTWFALPQTQNYFVIFLFFFLGTGLLWFIAGEMGWAGDFSSWKMGVQGKGAKPAASFFLGGVAGSAAFGLFYLFTWSFNKYFVLVSEVLDKSGEISYLGFKLLAYAIMFLLSISFGILAGVTIALSPSYIETRQRLVRLIFPSLLFVIFAGIIAGVHQNAVAKYDLGKKNLAEAVGIPEKSSISRTIILFKPGMPTIQEWPMEAKGSSVTGTNTIESSYENLKKVADYIDSHKNGSIYNYAAKDAIIKGYNSLWDVKKGIAYQAGTSEDILLHRLLLLSRLRNLPVTDENLSYLKGFTDENKWFIGGRYALRIAEAFMHFGLVDEAKIWLNKAKERGEDISKVTFLDEKPLKNGKVAGTIKVNGKFPANTRAALLQFVESLKEISDLTLNLRLVDVKELDSKGRFTFGNLGKGEYLLAVMTDKETIPYNSPPEKMKVENPPAVLRLNAYSPAVNLRDTNIVINK